MNKIHNPIALMLFLFMMTSCSTKNIKVTEASSTETTQQNEMSPDDNKLSDAEKADGWQLLFDGKTTNGFRDYKKETLGTSWKVENGTIYLDSKMGANGKRKAEDGGDLMTDGEYGNFEFTMDWKISDCGNSGILYFIHESEDYDKVWHTGPEMQILDNTCHPDAKIVTHRAGDLYDMIECSTVTVKPAGEWNSIKIVSKDGNMEQWQNGTKVVQFTMHDESWDAMVAKSKFKTKPSFGKYKKGHIAMQDHGDPVWFKNIKIRKI